MIALTATEEDAGERLDVVLVRRVPGMSRARAKTAIEAGDVRVNDRRPKKGQRVAVGDRIELPDVGDRAARPDAALALVILYEDAQLVAIDKPAGVPTHPLEAGEQGTIANALLARYPEMSGFGYSAREPGIVHRLDTETSGVLLAARDEKTWGALRVALAKGELDKRYLLLCDGHLDAPERIDVPLANDPKDARKVVACVDARLVERLSARPAVTEVLTSERAGPMSFCEVRAKAARRHQVRVHLAAAGHPLAGDKLYGGPEVPGLTRHFLHASSIGLRHPIDGRAMVIEAPLPLDLSSARGQAERMPVGD